MEKWIAENLSKHGLAWIVLLVIVLMVGPTGIDRMFDRFFPPQVSEDVTRGLDKIDHKQNKVDDVLKNQRYMIRSIGEISKAVEAVNRTTDSLDMRLVSVEAWKAYRESSIRSIDNP